MQSKNKRPYVWLVGIFAALGLSWAVASDVEVLHPATIHGFVAFGGETVQSFTPLVTITNGNVITQISQGTIAVTPGDPGPYHYEATVEGGDPADPDDTGRDYRMGMQAILVGADPQTSLVVQVNRTSIVHVPHTDPIPDVNFTYGPTDLAHVNVSVDLLGGTSQKISRSFVTVVQTLPNDTYFTNSSRSFAQPVTSLTTWVPVAVGAPVVVQGSFTVVDGNGAQTNYNVSQAVSGTLEAHLQIDLRNQGEVHGHVALALDGVVSSQAVQYRGAPGTATANITGTIPIVNGDYVASLPAGSYALYVETRLASPAGFSDASLKQVTVNAGDTAATVPGVDFIEPLGAAHVNLDLTGFYRVADLSGASLSVQRSDPVTGVTLQSQATSITNGRFDLALATGPWTVFAVSTSLQDHSKPNLPLQSSFVKIHLDGDGAVIRSDAGEAQSTVAEPLTLVRSNVYFEVADHSTLSNPNVTAIRVSGSVANHDRTATILVGNASTTGTQLGMTLVSEPGVYPLQAFATVNGQQVPFGGADSMITFGVPVTTEPGSGTPTPTGPDTIELVPPGQGNELQVSLDFSNLISDPSGGSVSTVVESPLGPAPPEGLSTLCSPPVDENGDPIPELTCDPIYYDIQTTAMWTGLAKVCVTRRYAGANGQAAFLALWHFNEGINAWEQLPPPDGEDATFDCSLNSALCGCATDAACQIGQCVDPAEDPAACTDTWNLFRVCGMTSSFSPVSPFVSAFPAITFTNVVNGVAYTGANGPGPQTWTVPATARYRITAQGAGGGHGTLSTTLVGGRGAEVSGEFALHKGDVLQILVGQQGVSTSRSAGGGGGTFVVKDGAPLIVAGGGGGVRSDATVNGRDGGTTTSGVQGSTTAGYTGSFVAGGSNGGGGARASSFGAGGGGWSGNGAADGSLGEGGFAFLSSATPGKGGAGKSCSPFADGGYGGGGAGNGCFGAGGGGGYSGGGGGRVGGGGGSFSAGDNSQFGVAATNAQGSVTIELVH